MLPRKIRRRGFEYPRALSSLHFAPFEGRRGRARLESTDTVVVLFSCSPLLHACFLISSLFFICLLCVVSPSSFPCLLVGLSERTAARVRTSVSPCAQLLRLARRHSGVIAFVSLRSVMGGARCLLSLCGGVGLRPVARSRPLRALRTTHCAMPRMPPRARCGQSSSRVAKPYSSPHQALLSSSVGAAPPRLPRLARVWWNSPQTRPNPGLCRVSFGRIRPEAEGLGSKFAKIERRSDRSSVDFGRSWCSTVSARSGPFFGVWLIEVCTTSLWSEPCAGCQAVLHHPLHRVLCLGCTLIPQVPRRRRDALDAGCSDVGRIMR